MDTLSLFNQQILLCQDEAYTLAWYLLGDEIEAEKTTQAAVEAAFRLFTTQSGKLPPIDPSTGFASMSAKDTGERNAADTGYNPKM